MPDPAPTTKAKLANQAFRDRNLIGCTFANQPKTRLSKYLAHCRYLDERLFQDWGNLRSAVAVPGRELAYNV